MNPVPIMRVLEEDLLRLWWHPEFTGPFLVVVALVTWALWRWDHRR